jgi:hypothetical protein
MVLLFSSCKKEEFVQPDYIVFGAIQGNCDDGCRFVYYLDNTKLAEDVTAKYFSTRNLASFTAALSNDNFLLAKDLLNKVPTALTKTNKTIFIDLNSGSPDLWYAEIKLDGRIFTWTFRQCTKQYASLPQTIRR